MTHLDERDIDRLLGRDVERVDLDGPRWALVLFRALLPFLVPACLVAYSLIRGAGR